MPLLNVNCRARRVLCGGGTSWSGGQERTSSRERKMHCMQLGMKGGAHFACAKSCKTAGGACSPLAPRAVCQRRRCIFFFSCEAWLTTYKQTAKTCQKSQHFHNMHPAACHRCVRRAHNSLPGTSHMARSACHSSQRADELSTRSHSILLVVVRPYYHYAAA